MDKCYSVSKAVSGIDDRFLEEAENVQKQSKRLTLRPVFSLAACIVLVLGLTLLWPRPLKLTVNGKNLLRTAVSYSQDAAPMALRAEQTLDVPLTLNPGRGGSVTLRADLYSSLEAAGAETDTLTLTKKTGIVWHLLPDRSQEFYLTVTQADREYLLLAQPDDTGGVTIRRIYEP